jgi:hypothetical protein
MDGTTMATRWKNCLADRPTYPGDMAFAATTTLKPTRTIRPPKGCEHHLTRKQAAAVLGFASEFKVRQLEKEGRLQSIRGAMGTAFYAQADLLALRSQLTARPELFGVAREWSDAELLALLIHPLAEGKQRSALDLVLETGIPIARAEAVVAFHARHGAAPSPVATKPTPANGKTPERRNPTRLSRDELIRSLRHPDPGVREQAFQALRDGH